MVDPFLPIQFNIMHHGVARPHHENVLWQAIAHFSEHALVCPATVIAGRAHDELLVGIRMFADEVLLNIVAELYLARGLTDFAVRVIYKDAEITHAEVIELLQFGAEFVHVRGPVLIAPVDGVGRVNCPEEAYMVFAGVLYHFFQFSRLVSRVGLIATGAVVVRVIFGCVDIGVELVSAVEIQLGQAGLCTPWNAVIALNNATIG